MSAVVPARPIEPTVRRFARAAAFALVAALSTWLGGCAARPGEAALQPVAAAGVDRTVEIFVATTRDSDPAGSLRFTAKRSYGVSYARYVIAVPPGHKPAEIEWPKGRPDPATSFAVLEAAPLGEAEFRRRVSARAAGVRDGPAVGTFVHGYNYSFQESLFRSAQIHADAKGRGAFVLFAWPSEASPTGYVADRDAAVFSRDALAYVLDGFGGDPKIRRAALIGHSMGGWLAMESLRQLRLTGRGAAVAKLENVVLAAPDIDADVFVKQLEVVGRLSPPLTVLVAKDDGALSLSRLLAGDHERVGLADIQDPRVQTAAKRYDVRVIDISAIASSGDLNHGRYAGMAAIYPQIKEQLDRPTGAGTFVLQPGSPTSEAAIVPAQAAVAAR